jgi:putative hemolysin
VLILIIGNGIFAMTEIAIVTSKKGKLRNLQDKGNTNAAYALILAENPNQLLSTIQIGITLIGVVTGAFGGASIAGQLAVYVEKVNVLAPFSYQLSIILVIGLTTYLSLIIGELVPKRIGMANPEKMACKVAKPMYYFSKVGRPLIWILSKSTEFVLRVLKVKPTDEQEVTEEEISQLIAQGVHSGAVEEIEQDLVKQIFYLGDKRLSDILTPRAQLVWIDIEDTYEENMQLINESPYSKYPVGKGSLDDFKGILRTKNLISKLSAGERIVLTDYIDETLILPEAMNVFNALETLKKYERHEAMVVDEYGGMEGFVTVHDIMENIVGELPEKDDEEEPQIIERNEHSWLADGLVSMETFIRDFELEADITLGKPVNYHTLGGFITNKIGDIPRVRDTVQVGDLQLEVVDMDRVRVDKVLISRIKTEGKTE